MRSKPTPLLLVLLLAAQACHQHSQHAAPRAPGEPVKVVMIEGLLHPWSMTFLDEDDVLITEKDGHLIRANLTDLSKRIVRGLPTDLVDSIRARDPRDNSGLFEVLKHPNYETNQRIYMSYAAESAVGTTTKVISARLKGDTLMDVQPIFIAEPYRSDLFHYGGGMTFGADDKLYITIGERYYNEMDQPPLPVAQDLKDKRGKIHRLNDDGTIPTDNPHFPDEAIPSIYALGIRAAQGITLDPRSGEIWFSEHGSVQGDELNRLQPGANYGWPIQTSGRYRNADYQPPAREGLTFNSPKHFWFQTIAPTGLAFYYGDEFPAWQGDIILAGLSRGSLWRIHLADDEVVSLEELFVNDRVRARKVSVSPEGKLYLLTDQRNGKLIRIVNGRNLSMTIGE